MYRLLDLFCGAGGAAEGYARAGFEVVGVDLEPQSNYPFEFIQANAITFPIEGFDAIHASPPCQRWTAYQRTNVVGEYPNLIPITRRRLIDSGLPWIIENLEQSPLIRPVILCGSSFGLDIRRHRAFECYGWPHTGGPPCNHAWQTPRFPPASNRSNLRSTVEVGAWRCSAYSPAAMGIDWMTEEELSESVPPAYTEFLGRQLHAFIRAREEAHAIHA